ncbi:MAG TPA: hypothetical protein VJG90_07340 [Candidatus Nanoarchaeia archaeon]|nr:hypothetical protein [Candidatus Nanoarchaeia archaeon]
MTFAKWVSFETIQYAGFNYWEPSLFYSKGQNGGTVYLSQIGSPAKDEGENLVVVEIRRNKDRYRRREWYFGTFYGKHSGQCKGEKQLQRFNRKIDEIATRKNRVRGRDLEERIHEAAKKAHGF